MNDMEAALEYAKQYAENHNGTSIEERTMAKALLALHAQVERYREALELVDRWCIVHPNGDYSVAPGPIQAVRAALTDKGEE